MSGDHAKREIVTGGDKSTSSGRTHSRESGHKNKEESSSSILVLKQLVIKQERHQVVVVLVRGLSDPLIKEKSSLSLGDRLREGKGLKRPGLCDHLNGE